MTTEIKELPLPNGKRIFIEVEIADNVIVPAPSNQIKDLPADAEPTGLIDNALSSMVLFQENIRNMAEYVYETLKDINPDTWSVEMNIGFKGTTNPVPFIASGELSGGIKVTATWKKDIDKRMNDGLD